MPSESLNEQEHAALLAAPALTSAHEGLTIPDVEQQNPGNLELQTTPNSTKLHADYGCLLKGAV
jgi:hypothetical protein